MKYQVVSFVIIEHTFPNWFTRYSRFADSSCVGQTDEKLNGYDASTVSKFQLQYELIAVTEIILFTLCICTYRNSFHEYDFTAEK